MRHLPVTVLLVAVLALCWAAPVGAGKGAPVPTFPRIAKAGGVYPVPDGVLMPDPGAIHRILIDASGDATTAEGRNRHLETAARTLNLYALAGVPADQVKLAVVIHGKATPLVLSDAAYREHLGTANPDASLVDALRAANVEFYVCAQALLHQGYQVEDVDADVQVSLSALSQVITLQTAGYALLPW